MTSAPRTTVELLNAAETEAQEVAQSIFMSLPRLQTALTLDQARLFVRARMPTDTEQVVDNVAEALVALCKGPTTVPAGVLVEAAIQRQIIPERNARFGCKDASGPETWSFYTLSRVLDMMRHARTIGGEAQAKATFATLPESLRLEFIYSSWRYVPEGSVP